MSNTEERVETRERLARERWQAYMHADYDPRFIPKHTPRAEDRMVAAMEYAAYQLGQINRRLERLMELTEASGRDGG